MPASCFYHPDRAAAHTCAQCGVPICEEDTDRVGGKTVCSRCVQAVRARVEAQMASSQAVGQFASPPNTGYAAGGPVGGPTARDGGAFGGNAYIMPPQAPSAAQRLVGLGLGLVISIVGAIAIEKFEMNLHLGLSLLYVLVGYAVGWGVLKGTGRGTMPIAAVAVVLYLAGIVAGIVAEAGDVLRMASGGTMAEALPFVFHHKDFMDWLFVAFGVYGCFRYVMRRA